MFLVLFVSDLKECVEDADFVLSSLPFSSIVKDAADEASSHLKAGAIWVDSTSGVPSMSQEIAKDLKSADVSFLDCGVAGGPIAAEAGTLSGMVSRVSFLPL